MRRAPVVLAATAAGLFGVLGFHTKTARVVISSSSSTTPGPAPSAPSTSSGSATASSSTPKKAVHRTAGSAKSPAPATGATRFATGALEQYGYGELAVKVIVTGNKITAVDVPTIRVADSYSGNLASYVIPILRSEVLKAQSANINGISGATYTTEAYLASVQSALDKLHVR